MFDMLAYKVTETRHWSSKYNSFSLIYEIVACLVKTLFVIAIRLYSQGVSSVPDVLLKDILSGRTLSKQQSPLSSGSSGPCQSFLFHSCAAHKRLHGFSPVSHSQPMLAVLWTKLNVELPPIPSQHGIHPDPTEKWLTSCSHTMPTALSKSNPNNAHPQLISTSEPKRKLADHTSIWATLNVKRPTYMHTQKNAN